MKSGKSDLITILFSVILLIIVISTAVIFFTSSNQQPKQTVNTTALQPSSTPTPTLILNDSEQSVSYEENAQEKLMDKIENRKPLSNNDAVAKATILAELPNENPSGILYQSNTIIIDYTNSANMFQVEILTTDIAAAKAEANVWFRARGMSQQGICDLPLMFYLNFEIRSQLQNSGTAFNPIANSCE